MTVGEVPVLRLPGGDEVGTHATWSLPGGERSALVTLTGRLLGVGTSRKDQHTHVPPEAPDGRYAERGERCGACRWFEPRIFREDLTGRYLLYYTGESIVPGETPRHRYEWVASAHEVLEALTTRRRSPRSGDKEAFFTVPAARALAQAASNDHDLRDAWENRAVL